MCSFGFEQSESATKESKLVISHTLYWSSFKRRGYDSFEIDPHSNHAAHDLRNWEIISLQKAVFSKNSLYALRSSG